MVRSKNILRREYNLNVKMQNDVVEIFFVYFFGFLALLFTVIVAKAEYLDVAKTALLFMIPIFLLIIFLIFRAEKIIRKKLPYHDNSLLLNIIQILGTPAIFAAWILYIENIATIEYKRFAEQGFAISTSSIVNYIFLAYLVIFSIKLFTSVSISKDNVELEAKRTILNPIIIITSIAIGLVVFFNSLDALKIAFVQSFLAASIIFEILTKIHQKNNKKNRA